jgi:archaeosine synthase
MEGRPLARGVEARQRFSRIFSLGDRNNPLSWSPSLVLSDLDPQLPISIAPFASKRNSASIPGTVSVTTRGNFCFPFDSIDTGVSSEGLILPPSLAESDSGITSSGSEVILVSWQSLHHDAQLNDEDLEPSIIVLVDAPQLVKSQGMLVDALDIIRVKFPSSLIWTPGIGGPDNCALLSWLGVDLFDLSRSRSAAALGVILTIMGPREVDHSIEEKSDINAQCSEWISAIAATRSAIREGSLRELAERQSTSSPKSVEHLRFHDTKMAKLEGGRAGLARILGHNAVLRCNSFTSRSDALIQDWRKRVSKFHTPPKHQTDVLLLLPCSATKPYRLSQSHQRFARSINTRGVHEVMVTAPLGLVPRELEDIWPASNYDIPVTGDWDNDELEIINDMINKLVKRVQYSRVINHSGMKVDVDGIEVIDTRNGSSAGSSDSLATLNLEINRAIEDFKIPKIKESIHRLGKLEALSRFQHQSDKWLEGTKIEGRPPIFTIKKDGLQLAQWNPRSGRFAFSKSCLTILDEHNTLSKIHLNKTHVWKGDLFSTNVDYIEGEIRRGDEVLVFQNDKLIGSARAEAPGWEWPDGPGRLGRAQHRL